MRHWTVHEVATALSVCDEQVRRWARAGLLEPRKLGREYRFADDVVRQFIRSRCKRVGDDAPPAPEAPLPM